MRARIDVSEIEAQTKIRAKYLRALENEEWGLLAGADVRQELPAHLRAGARSSTARRWSRNTAWSTSARTSMMLEPIVSTPQRNQGRGGRSGRATARRAATCSRWARSALVIVVLIVLLISGGGGGAKPRTTSTSKSAAQTGAASAREHRRSANAAGGQSADSSVMSLSLKTTGPVFVCLLGDGGRRLIPGLNLPAGETTQTYHAKHFAITLGNSSVTMYVDGSVRTVPPSSEPIGYSITKAQGRETLSAARCRPANEVAVSVRAGIVVTGTEVLTGRVSDRNGPWLAERLRELGVDLAYTTIVGDRPEDMRAALELHGGAGDGHRDHERRPGADGGRPDRGGGGRVPGPGDGARRGARRSGSRRSCARWRNVGRTSTWRRSARATTSRRRCPSGATILEPVGTAPGLVVPPSQTARPRRWSCCRGRRASCSRCGRTRSTRTRYRRRSLGRRSIASARCACSGSPSRRSPRRCAWPSARGSRLASSR